MHIMTKELRHWQWITMWWSDKPDIDFGEDRPSTFDALPGVWGNYKMCVVADYTEQDGEMSGRFSDMPTLQAALEATNSGVGGPTWCSNPYIEHGAGNARTNCIGCHQHAGTRFVEDGGKFDLDKIIGDAGLEVTDTNLFPANGRIQRRNKFASDYSWAFSRLDDLTTLIRKEVEFKGSQDPRWVRVDDIVLDSQDPAVSDTIRGEEVFRKSSDEESCTDCHGDQGQGDFGPAYEQLFAQKTDWELLNTIIEGRGDMPAWGEILTDAQMADLLAYLRGTFAPQD
jgi:mono/diheme cytochrome c family protein